MLAMILASMTAKIVRFYQDWLRKDQSSRGEHVQVFKVLGAIGRPFPPKLVLRNVDDAEGTLRPYGSRVYMSAP